MMKLLPLLITGLIITGCASIRSHMDMPPDTAALGGEGNHYYNFILSEMENRHDRIDQAIEHMTKAVAAQPESVFLKKELVYLYLQNKNTDKALKTIEVILAEQPTDIGTLIIAGTIKKQIGRDEEAAAIFETVLALRPEQEKIYHVLGEYYLEKNDLEKATDVYEQMTRQFPELWEGFFFLGKIQARQKKFSAAERNFRRCLELTPSLISPRFELIELYKQQAANITEIIVQPGDTLFSLCRKHYQRYDKALVNKIISANPQISDINSLAAGQKLLLPESAQTSGTAGHEEIIRLYDSILKEYPDNYRAAMELALYYYSIGSPRQGDELLIDLGRKGESAVQHMMQYISQVFISRQKYDDARSVLVGLLRGAPDRNDLHYLLGIIYDKQEQPAEALRHFSRVEDNSSFYTAALLQMAFLYEEAGKPEKAKAVFDLLLEKEPDNVELLIYAGSFLERQEQYEQAKALFLRGMQIDPENLDLLFRLGVIYDKTGQKESVIEHMKTIIEIAPDDANALNYLGYTYADMGIKLDEAQRLIEKALQIEPDNGYITDSLGWVYYQKGEFEKAIELLIRAVRLSPNDSILLEHLGDAYLKNGDRKDAIDAYQRSLEFVKSKEDKDKITKKIQDLLRQVDIP